MAGIPNSLVTINFQEKTDELRPTTNPCRTYALTTSSLEDPQQKESNEPEQQERFLDEINRLERRLLPPELLMLDLDMLKQNYNNAKSISILVTGKTGSGKSTLVNAILRLKKAKAGLGVQPITKAVTSYQAKKGKIDVTVWDSPGLQDGTDNQEKYLQDMKQECMKRDFTLYCIKMLEIRFVPGNQNPDVRAMKALTQTFGVAFWETTIIVLTFANIFITLNVIEEWETLSAQARAEAFKEKIQDWEAAIKQSLIQDIAVPEKIVRAIKVIPAGSCKQPHFLAHRYWLSALWFHCLDVIPTTEAKIALVRLNEDRLISEDEVEMHQFQEEPENQPIVLSERAISNSCREDSGTDEGEDGRFMEEIHHIQETPENQPTIVQEGAVGNPCRGDTGTARVTREMHPFQEAPENVGQQRAVSNLRRGAAGRHGCLCQFGINVFERLHLVTILILRILRSPFRRRARFVE